VNAEKCLADFIGRTHERNTCRAPWMNTLDGRLNIGLPFKRVKTEITLDVLNMINLFDNQSGLIKYANFNDLLVLRPEFSGSNVIYNLSNLFLVQSDGSRVRQTPEEQFTRFDLASRWQIQLGARVRF
jgi:hypothetical protein